MYERRRETNESSLNKTKSEEKIKAEKSSNQQKTTRKKLQIITNNTINCNFQKKKKIRLAGLNTNSYVY